MLYLWRSVDYLDSLYGMYNRHEGAVEQIQIPCHIAVPNKDPTKPLSHRFASFWWRTLFFVKMIFFSSFNSFIAPRLIAIKYSQHAVFERGVSVCQARDGRHIEEQRQSHCRVRLCLRGTEARSEDHAQEHFGSNNRSIKYYFSTLYIFYIANILYLYIFFKKYWLTIDRDEHARHQRSIRHSQQNETDQAWPHTQCARRLSAPEQPNRKRKFLHFNKVTFLVF